MFTKNQNKRECAGLTLVEYVLSVGLGSMVAAALIGFSIYTGRSFAGLYNYMELEAQSRQALDTMTRDLRQTGLLTGYSSNHVSFLDPDGAPLSFRYSPESRSLVRVKGGQTNQLLSGCDSLIFGIFQRNTTNGTYDQYPTSLVASNTKVIQLSWVCSREITGTRINTESMQTAKIVLRNQ